MQCVLDTNVLLEVLLRRNEQHFAECFALLDQVKKGNITAVVPGIVLAELQWVMSSFYNLPKREIAEFLESILHVRGLKISDEYDHEQSIRLYAGNTVKYIDAIIASMRCVQNSGYVVVSYDTEFKRLPIEFATPGAVLSRMQKKT